MKVIGDLDKGYFDRGLGGCKFKTGFEKGN